MGKNRWNLETSSNFLSFAAKQKSVALFVWKWQVNEDSYRFQKKLKKWCVDLSDSCWRVRHKLGPCTGQSQPSSSTRKMVFVFFKGGLSTALIWIQLKTCKVKWKLCRVTNEQHRSLVWNESLWRSGWTLHRCIWDPFMSQCRVTWWLW